MCQLLLHCVPTTIHCCYIAMYVLCVHLLYLITLLLHRVPTTYYTVQTHCSCYIVCQDTIQSKHVCYIFSMLRSFESCRFAILFRSVYCCYVAFTSRFHNVARTITEFKYIVTIVILLLPCFQLPLVILSFTFPITSCLTNIVLLFSGI